MKRPILLITLVLVLLITSCKGAAESTSSAATDPPSILDPFELDFKDRVIFESNLVRAEAGILDESDGFTTYHLDLELADNLYSASARMEVLYTNNEQEPLDEIYFRL